MGSEWREYRLGELIESFDSFREPVKAAERVEGPYPYYGASGIVDHVDDYLFDGEYLLIAEDGENLKTRNTPIAFMATGKFWVNNHAHVVRGNNLADTKFLMYALAKTDILGYLTGSTIPKLSQASLNAIVVRCPSIEEQRRIVHILGTLDDKIELNRQMNKTLEEMARALFKSWFVDFDPVRAKMEGRWTRDNPLPGLPTHLFDLFPDHLVDSELGEIPAGWAVSDLPHQIDYLEGPGLRNWQYTDNGMRFLNIRCIVNGDLDIAKASAISLREFETTYRHFALHEDDIVISTSGTLGRLAIVRSDHLPLMLNTSIIRMRGREPVGLAFVWGFLQSQGFLEEMFAAASGSVQLNFGPTHLQRIRMIQPPKETSIQFEEVVQPMIRKSLRIRNESKSLRMTRDEMLLSLLAAGSDESD